MLSRRVPVSTFLGCALLAAVAGCAPLPAIRPAARVATVENRHITTSPRKIDLAIHVRPSVADDPRIEMEVKATSDDLPRRFVVQKQWAGDEEALEHLSGPRVECDGKVVDVTVDDLETHVGWATATRCGTAIVRYVLRPPKPRLEWGYEFDVVATRELVTAIAESTLLLPDVPDATRAHVTVEFDLAGMPQGAEGVYSLGPGGHDTTMRALRHAYFAAGKFVTVKHQSGNLSLEARAPVGAGLESPAATRDLARLLEAEAKIFSDEHPEPLRLLVVGMPAGGGAHGTSLSASAIVWRDRTTAWTQEDARLVAHEMFHLYNGQIIERTAGTGSDAETYWFSEGFTEHYTDELLRRSGVVRAHDWFEAVRERVRRYHRHPDCETPNDKADMRWGGAAVQLPYLRGAMIAAYVDYEMRNHSAGARTLDDFMRGLLVRARAGLPPIDPSEMVRLISEEIGAELGGIVRSVALGGKRLMLPKDAFGSCVEVSGSGGEQDVRIRAGVDLEACMRSGG
ncbi:MAG: hypothetical protein HYV09_08665 [Deltaproteobacteria bacterium]|nr:hypothetical protein [Deltaproteobacteria bacterium]